MTFVDNGDGTATLAGTPAAGSGGTYPFTITAHNATAPDATQPFTLTVNEAPSITSADATTFTVGTAGTFTVTTGQTSRRPTLSDGGGRPARRGDLSRQRRRHGHAGRHAGGRHRRHLPVHHHRRTTAPHRTPPSRSP